ncbi:hypothetical protein ES319_D10G093100v1 [Gossypium barbadense]|uniref:Uncharacterized protein n=2 Tax=Gossypium TaxID=3633 RepID=A0A5J5PPK0_GOSBA|nr:hypothetical protein ES319_D10G093100v1 [Gossypium barbadense]TYG49505.1 hypothetical protein ES288_D10G099700v1 [Gossypium darwinii]
MRKKGERKKEKENKKKECEKEREKKKRKEKKRGSRHPARPRTGGPMMRYSSGAPFIACMRESYIWCSLILH